VDGRGGVVDIALAAGGGGGVEARGIGLGMLEEALQAALEAVLRLHLLQFAAQARAFRQAEFVALAGGHVGGGVLRQSVGLMPGTVGVGLADTGGVHRGLVQLAGAEGDQAVVGGLARVQQRLAGVFLQFGGALGGDRAGLGQRIGLGLGVGPQRAVGASV